MSRRRTRNRVVLLSLIYSEMCWLAVIWPNNPADSRAIVENAKVVERQLPSLARILLTLAHESVTRAWEELDDYEARYGIRGVKP